MYTIKGFMLVQPMADNDPNQVSVLGELSTYARTYSRDLGHYSNDAYTDIDFVSFLSEDSVNGAQALPLAYSSIILEIGQWMYDQALLGSFTTNAADCASAVLAHFSGQIVDVSVGNMVQYSGSTYLPEYIAFSKEPNATEPNTIKIWFSDAAFRTQYDEYEITIVPPIDNVDGLIQPALEVKALLDAVTDTVKMERVQTASDGDPATTIKTVEYDWSNPSDPSIVLSTPWTILIYGIAGNNIDIIKAELASYILANSTNVQSVWEQYIPDIFRSTEFILTPLWDRYSIPNETMVAGIFSPTILVSDMLSKAQATAPDYDAAHVESVLCSSVAIYRSTAFLAVGGPDNRDGIDVLYDQFPDYFVVSSTSLDFGKMSNDTQGWVTLLTRMLDVANDMTEFSELPVDMSRLNRGGVMYVAASYQDVQYLVVSRQSYETLFPAA